MQIKDRVIVITGASAGIGFETAKYLASKGAKLVLAARSKDKLESMAKSLPDAIAVQTDMRNSADVKKLIDQAIKKYGRIDILINNAGQGIYGPLEKINVEDFKQVMELNVYGVLEAMQAVIPQMRTQGGGMILNVSSGVSRRYIPGLAAYASTKYALNALTFTAHQELEKDNIIVTTILPKMTATDFGKNAIGSRPDFSGRPGALPEVDPPEKVAEKIAELIETEQTELVL